jgi:hydrogenase expression/formation protein HypC
MCLAVPGKVISIDESNPDLKMAKVNFNGLMKNVCVQWLPDLKVGEYVLVHVGFALNKIDEKEAIETLQILKEMGDLENYEEGDIN